MTCHCKRCLADWESFVEKPRKCARCGSPLWDKDPVRKAGAGRKHGASAALALNNETEISEGKAKNAERIDMDLKPESAVIGSGIAQRLNRGPKLPDDMSGKLAAANRDHDESAPVERELTPMELRAERIAAFGNKKPVMPGVLRDGEFPNDFGDVAAKEEDVSQIHGRGRKRK